MVPGLLALDMPVLRSNLAGHAGGPRPAELWRSTDLAVGYLVVGYLRLVVGHTSLWDYDENDTLSHAMPWQWHGGRSNRVLTVKMEDTCVRDERAGFPQKIMCAYHFTTSSRR